MSVLGIIDPQDCDVVGVPLDWERCRRCEGSGTLGTLAGVGLRESEPVASDGSRVPCERCDGHGSLKAAALAHFRREAVYDEPDPPIAGRELERRAAAAALRCEGCGHPMSDGTWGDPTPVEFPESRYARFALQAVTMWRGGREPNPARGPTHWSPCDEGCRHGGPGRRMPNDRLGWIEGGPGLKPEVLHEITTAGVPYEASWRAVDVRVGMVAKRAGLLLDNPAKSAGENALVARPFDLRPENLGVLCLRCWAA